MKKWTTLLAVLTLFSLGLQAVEPGAAEGRAKKEKAIRNYVRELEQDSLMNTTAWSIVIRNVKTGETLVEHNPKTSLAGASITKLLTTGAALVSLGGDFHYTTRLAYSGQVVDSTLYGTLYVIGGGDPTLGSDYDKFLPGIDSVFSVWKKALNRAGIARIEGRMVADSRYFSLEPMIDSWSWDDADTYYGTNVQGLSFFENKCYLSFEPSDTLGRPARFTGVFPQTPGLTVINRTHTVEGRSNGIWLNASPLHPLEHFATGTLGAERGEVTETGANRAAGLSLLCEFHRYLCPAGDPGEVEYVLWDSYTEPSDTTAPGQVILEYDSPALRTIASVTNKYSDNMYAETIFRTMGKILGKGDTRSDARRVELAVLDSIAPGSRTLNLQDGSGLSRMSFLNAGYYADFLCGMYRTEAFDDFFASLAVPGGEGTFKNTIRDCPTRTRLHIKSGTLSGVRGLAGYSLNEQGELLCFVVMVNRYHSLSPISTRLNRLLELISAY